MSLSPLYFDAPKLRDIDQLTSLLSSCIHLPVFSQDTSKTQVSALTPSPSLGYYDAYIHISCGHIHHTSISKYCLQGQRYTTPPTACPSSTPRFEISYFGPQLCQSCYIAKYRALTAKYEAKWAIEYARSLNRAPKSPERYLQLHRQRLWREFMTEEEELRRPYVGFEMVWGRVAPILGLQPSWVACHTKLLHG